MPKYIDFIEFFEDASPEQFHNNGALADISCI